MPPFISFFNFRSNTVLFPGKFPECFQYFRNQPQLNVHGNYTRLTDGATWPDAADTQQKSRNQFPRTPCPALQSKQLLLPLLALQPRPTTAPRRARAPRIRAASRRKGVKSSGFVCGWGGYFSSKKLWRGPYIRRNFRKISLPDEPLFPFLFPEFLI